MPCYHPIHGYRSKLVNESGKRSIVFNSKRGYIDLPVSIPCGQCIGCRLERSRQWAIRISHEAQLYEKNCFITLTYSEQNLPDNKSLHLPDFQLFMKRLRKKFGSNIRFFHCGEYGEKFSRPHYHACIFNHDFSDKKFKSERRGFPVFSSETLDSLWGKGLTEIGSLTFQSAAYCARYITKKITGPFAEQHYTSVIFDLSGRHGEILERAPEYVTMSRNKGIGHKWLAKFQSDVYPDDFVVINGKKMRPPKYYDNQYEITDPNSLANLKTIRKLNGKKHQLNNTPDRLAVREKIQKYKFSQLKRSFENGDSN
ncbi:MAG: replication initiator protein [Arizlama microvirus]|nr:MAG: replication initiator protein [Arizlama microvirus]